MRPQRPTRRQKQIIGGFGLKAEKFLVVCETDDMMKLYNKESKRNIIRYIKEKKA